MIPSILRLMLFLSSIRIFSLGLTINDIKIKSNNIFMSNSKFIMSQTLLSNSLPNLPPDQFDALWEFYNSTKGGMWQWQPASPTSQIWDFKEPNPNPCYEYWQGITCLCNATMPQ